MSLPPVFSATLQSAVLSASSNILAQAITAYRSDKSLIVDWVPVAQFFIFTIVSTPPNYLWQEFLEASFPAYKASPTQEAVASAGAGNEKELDKEASEGRLVEPKLDVNNTLIKITLDQTFGAAFNTLMFSVFMHSVQAAMAHRTSGSADSATFLFSKAAIDYSQVDWRSVMDQSLAEFWPIVAAGWKLWPWISFVNFAFVKTVSARNLIGSLAGLVWGVYMSLIAAR